jgi:hypothetical protein
MKLFVEADRFPVSRTRRHSCSDRREFATWAATAPECGRSHTGAPRSRIQSSHQAARIQRRARHNGCSGVRGSRTSGASFCRWHASNLAWMAPTHVSIGISLEVHSLVPYPSRATPVQSDCDRYRRSRTGVGISGLSFVAGARRSYVVPGVQPSTFWMASAKVSSWASVRLFTRSWVLDPSRLPARRRHHHRPGVEGAPQAVVA